MTDPQKEFKTWEGTYPDDWHKYQVLRISFWTMFICVNITMFLGIVLWGMSHGWAAAVFGCCALLSFAWLLTGFYVNRWNCPQCHESFSESNWLYFLSLLRFPLRTFLPDIALPLFLAKDNIRCVHCGLPRQSLTSYL